MIDDLATQALLGPFRGEAAVDRDALDRGARRPVGAGRRRGPTCVSVDVNPLIVDADGAPVAVDALVEVGEPAVRAADRAARRPTDRAVPRPVRAARRGRRRRVDPPGQVRLRRPAQHPGQRLRRAASSPPTCRARRCSASHDRRRRRRPARRRRRPRLRVHAGGGQRRRCCGPARPRACAAAFLTVGRLRRGRRRRAGAPRRELVAAGRRARHPARRPQRPGRGQHAGRRCAPRSSRPTRRPGASASPARAATSCRSFLNYARASRRRHQPGGVGRQRRRRRRSPTTSTSTPTTPATAVGLAYVEGITDGRAFFERARRGRPRASRSCSSRAGATAGGARAAASHTGALAADDKVFDGACRQAGVTRAATVEEAFEAAATFATQPLPAGPERRRADHRRRLGRRHRRRHRPRPRPRAAARCPPTCARAIDAQLPPRWSRNNPVDCAGGETRDTIPEVMRADRRAPRRRTPIVYLGLGIQSNQARLMREGRFYPGYGLERIVAYHERQDARFAEAAAELSDGDRQADPDRHRAGRRRPGQRRSGRRARQPDGSATRRQPGRHRARPPVPRRPPPPPTPGRSDRRSDGHRAAERRRWPRSSPCWRSRRWRCSASGASPTAARRHPTTSMPPTTLAPPTTVAPAAALTTPLLSFRRAARADGARPQPGSAFGQQAQAFADTLDATSCVVGRRRRRTRRQPQPRPAGDPGEQPEAAGRGRRARRRSARTSRSPPRCGRRPRPSGGVLAGDLYLVGGGDPLLTSRRLSSAANDHHPEVINADVARHARRRGRGGRASPRSRAASSATARATTTSSSRPAWSRRHPRHRGRADRRPARQRRPLQGQQRHVAGRQRPGRRRRRGAGPAAARTRGVDRRRREHRHRAEQRHQRGEHRLGAAPGRRRRDDDDERQQHRRDAAQGDGRALRAPPAAPTPAPRR